MRGDYSPRTVGRRDGGREQEAVGAVSGIHELLPPRPTRYPATSVCCTPPVLSGIICALTFANALWSQLTRHSVDHGLSTTPEVTLQTAGYMLRKRARPHPRVVPPRSLHHNGLYNHNMPSPTERRCTRPGTGASSCTPLPWYAAITVPISAPHSELHTRRSSLASA